MSIAVAEGVRAGDPETVCWIYDPWSERPRAAWTGAIIVLLLCVLIVSLGESVLLKLGLCLFCAGVFAPALARVECRIEAAGVARRGLLGWERRSWSSIQRLDRLPAGVLLSPHARPHVLDGARGLMLPMPEARREALTRLVADALERSR